jgi:hypothetical protein
MGSWGSDGLEGLVIQGDGENFIVLDPGGARNPRRLGTFIRTAELPNCCGTALLVPCMKAWISSRVRRPSLFASIALKIRSLGLELRNVAANYPFVRAHRFPGIQPNSAHRDCSRLSCAAGEMPLGPRAAGSSASISHRAAIAVRHKLPRFLPIQRCSAGGQTSNTIAHFALDFERKESVCGVHGHRA